MAARLEFARTVRERSLETPHDAWEAAARRVAGAEYEYNDDEGRLQSGHGNSWGDNTVPPGVCTVSQKG